jgi:uncharacterized Tic20 family protein
MTTSGEEPLRREQSQHSEHSPPGGPSPYGGPPAWTAGQEERTWAMAAHVGSFVTASFALGLIAPLVVLLAKGNASPYIRRHAVESLNFQINALIYIAVFFMLIFVVIGIPLLIAYGIFYLVVVILATVRASNGADYRYPATIRFIS